MTERIDIKKLDNGLVIVGAPMEGVGSAAFDFFVPCGATVLPADCGGAAVIINDWMFRGAGGLSSRELVDKLGGLGLHRGEKVTSRHIVAGAAMEAGNLDKALELYADIILRPEFDDEQFEFSRQLALAELVGLDDDPRRKTLLELKKQFYPEPLGRSTLGSKEEIEKLTPQVCRDIVSENFNPDGMVFAIAGKYNLDSVSQQIEKLFAGVEVKGTKKVSCGKYKSSYNHIDYDGAQVHIGLMCPAAMIQSDDYYNVRVAVAILSGGMSSRLFTEVREKRGLCYSVGASYNSLKEMAGVSCYVGTMPEKSQQAYDVIVEVFGKLGDGISEDELDRAKAGLKSALVMAGESSSARSMGCGNDYHLLGRVRKFEEIKAAIDKVTVESVVECVKANPFEDFTVVSIGPNGIRV